MKNSQLTLKVAEFVSQFPRIDAQVFARMLDYMLENQYFGENIDMVFDFCFQESVKKTKPDVQGWRKSIRLPVTFENPDYIVSVKVGRDEILFRARNLEMGIMSFGYHTVINTRTEIELQIKGYLSKSDYLTDGFYYVNNNQIICHRAVIDGLKIGSYTINNIVADVLSESQFKLLLDKQTLESTSSQAITNFYYKYNWIGTSLLNKFSTYTFSDNALTFKK
mgnify:CR=1 FL=1